MKEIISNLISTGYALKSGKEYIVLNYDDYKNSYVYLKNKLMIIIYRGFKYSDDDSIPPSLQVYLLHDDIAINVNDTKSITIPIKTAMVCYDLDAFYAPEKITKQQALKECHKFMNDVRGIIE